jgi:hypothetical protein
MDFFDMMRVDITKKDAFSCLILVLLRGLVFKGLARDVVVGAGYCLRCEPLSAW